MMRKNITRTLDLSTIKGYALKIVDGQPQAVTLEPVTVCGKATEKEGLKALKEKYGNGSIAVSEISVETNTYEISVEDFLKYATKVEKNENEKEIN